MKTPMNYYLKETIRCFFLLTLFLLLVVPFSYSQSVAYYKPKHNYIGIEGGFGVRSFTLASNIPQLDQLTTVKGGGSIGFIYGTPTVKIPFVMGLYYQPVQEAVTIDLFALQTGVDISLLHLMGLKDTPIDIYTVTGIDFQNFTFMGTYLKVTDDKPRREIFGEPYLGRKSILNANVGVGIEVRIRDDFDFIHLFLETRKTYPLKTGATEFFNETGITNNMAINIGLRVGAVK